MRRFGRTGRRPHATLNPLLPQVIALLSSTSRSGATAALFLASTYTDSGAGKVSSFTDILDGTHTLAQATDANRVAAPTSDSGLAGALSAAFTGTQFYTSSRAASAWKFLHDGTGMHAIHVFKPTDVAASHTGWATANSGAANVGTVVYANAGPAYYSPTVSNGTILTVTTAAAKGGTPTSGAPVYTNFSYSETASPKWSFGVSSTAISSGSPAGVPSAASPVSSLRIGANSGSGVTDKSNFRALLIAARPFTASELALVQRWIKSDSGVA